MLDDHLLVSATHTVVSVCVCAHIQIDNDL